MRKKAGLALTMILVLTIGAAPALAAQGTDREATQGTAQATDQGATQATAQGANQAAPTQVSIDGQPVVFRAAPFVQGDTTMVEFRAVFEKLGYSVGWDAATQTASAARNDSVIHVRVGSAQADIDGKEGDLAQAPVEVRGIVFVPLAWVGEASGREISRDDLAKSAYIAPTDMQLIHVISLNIKYTQDKNVDGVMSTVDPRSPVYDNTKAVLQQLAAYDIAYTLAGYKVEKVDGNQAVVSTVIRAASNSGPAIKGNQTTALQLMIRGEDGWKLFQSQPLEIDYRNEDQYKEQPITLSDQEKKKILDVIEQDRALAEKKDFEGEKKLYDANYPNLEQEMATSQYLAAYYDFKMENEDIEWIEATDTEAKLKITTKISKVSGPNFVDNRSVSVDTLKKDEEGNWKFVNDDALKIEYLIPGYTE